MQRSPPRQEGGEGGTAGREKRERGLLCWREERKRERKRSKRRMLYSAEGVMVGREELRRVKYVVKREKSN